MKSVIRTRLVGILSLEIFEGFPENLPKKYQKQMFLETLYLKDRELSKPEKFIAYTKHSMQLLYLEMLQINFIHKLGKGEHQEFLKTNPLITEICKEDYLADNLPNTNISYNEFIEFLQSDSEEAQRVKSKAAKKERMQKAWLFDYWLLYQEVIVVMGLLESFLRESYDIYVLTFPEIENLSKINKDSDYLCFSKLLEYFMKEELKLVQRFGDKNKQFLKDFWIYRNAIAHNSGVINERSLRSNPSSTLKPGKQIMIDPKILEKLYSLLSNLQRIVYKKVRFENEKKKEFNLCLLSIFFFHVSLS